MRKETLSVLVSLRGEKLLVGFALAAVANRPRQIPIVVSMADSSVSKLVDHVNEPLTEGPLAAIRKVA